MKASLSQSVIPKLICAEYKVTRWPRFVNGFWVIFFVQDEVRQWMKGKVALKNPSKTHLTATFGAGTGTGTLPVGIVTGTKSN